MDLSISSVSVVYFFIYAILGWVCEVVYCAVIDRQIENRGFLFGPYCPIYGFGAVIVLKLLVPLEAWPVWLFFAAMVACTLLEYVTSWAMEKVFDMRWWDYSQLKFNINGRVCLLNSVLFGVLGLALVYVVHPIVSDVVEKMPHPAYPVLAVFIVLSMSLDFMISAKELFNASYELAELKAHYERFKAAQAQKRLQVKDSIRVTIRRLRAQRRGKIRLPFSEQLLSKLDSINLKNRKLQQMLSRPSGSMNLHELGGALQMLRAYLDERKRDFKEGREGSAVCEEELDCEADLQGELEDAENAVIAEDSGLPEQTHRKAPSEGQEKDKAM